MTTICNKRSIVLHLTTGLRCGGAEMMLTRLVTAFGKSSAYDHVIVSLMPGNDFADEHRHAGIRVINLNMHTALSAPWKIMQLKSIVATLKPALIHGWMYHGNMAAHYAGKGIPHIFSVHNSLDALSQEKWLTRRILFHGAKLSKYARAVVYCAENSRLQHEKIGYNPAVSATIPNGVDTHHFSPDDSSVNFLKELTGIPAETFLFGQVARFHPIKNQTGLLRAFGLFAAEHPSACLVLVGDRCDSGNEVIMRLLKEYAIADRVFLLGQRNDTHLLIPGLDALISPSLSESFPVVVTEAMACGVPCIATDTGDSSQIVGDTGLVIPADNDEQLAKAMKQIAGLGAEERRQMGGLARKRIESLFSFEDTVSAYDSLYRSILNIFKD